MRLRYWALALADAMLVLHIIMLSFIVINSRNNQFTWMFSAKIPSAIYIAVNVMPIVVSSFLYMGIFRLSTKLIFLWLTAMVLVWHIPAILIFYILCIDKPSHNAPYLSKQRILAPSLWLCIWILLMINVFKLYTELKKFKKHPQFLRTNIALVKKITDLNRMRAKQPGKFLLTADSDVKV